MSEKVLATLICAGPFLVFAAIFSLSQILDIRERVMTERLASLSETVRRFK